jgi:hypothetical protein
MALPWKFQHSNGEAYDHEEPKNEGCHRGSYMPTGRGNMTKGKCKQKGQNNMRYAIEDHRLLYVPNKLTKSHITLKGNFDECSHGYEFLKVKKINHVDTWNHILQ